MIPNSIVPNVRHVAVCTPFKIFSDPGHIENFDRVICYETLGYVTFEGLDVRKKSKLIWPQKCIICLSKASQSRPVSFSTTTCNRQGTIETTSNVERKDNAPICARCASCEEAITYLNDASRPMLSLLAIFSSKKKNELQAIKDKAATQLYEIFPEFDGKSFEDLLALFQHILLPVYWKMKTKSKEALWFDFSEAGLAFINLEYAREFVAKNNLSLIENVKG